MTIAKIYPDDEEALSDLYYRMLDSIEYYMNKHQDVTITLKKVDYENHILIKTLILEDSIN